MTHSDEIIGHANSQRAATEVRAPYPEEATDPQNPGHLALANRFVERVAVAPQEDRGLLDRQELRVAGARGSTCPSGDTCSGRHLQPDGPKNSN